MTIRSSLLVCALIFALAAAFESAQAQTENMQVSVVKDEFGHGFAGPMVVQVVIDDDDLNSTVARTGMPDVTVQGRILNMAQGTDGRWYGYFAAIDAARAADQTALDTGLTGLGLDFGVFVANDTPISVFGIEMFGIHSDFTDTDGFALPRSGGLSAFSNGTSPAVIPQGAGSLVPSDNLNNVVRNPATLNPNADPAVAFGQVGLDANAWPNLQLYELTAGEDTVFVHYNKGGGVQVLQLDYNSLAAPTITLDKAVYEPGDDVLLTIRDPQLNIDPTDRDSWTFNVTGPVSTFYRAFAADGANEANGTAALADLVPALDAMGFGERGELSMTLTGDLELGTNSHQPVATADNGGGTTFSSILTLFETGANSGEFTSFDGANQSILRIADDATPGIVGVVHYAGQSIPIVVPEPASVGIAMLLTLGLAGVPRRASSRSAGHGRGLPHQHHPESFA